MLIRYCRLMDTHVSFRSGQLFALLFILCLSGAGCAGEASQDEAESASSLPSTETRADSLAMRAYEALGGPEAWAALPYLRFDFAVEQDGNRQLIAHHLWNRQTGDYRVEWPAGSDSTYTALFNVNARKGQVYLNGDSVASARNDTLLQQAYRRYINDSYWLLAPTKMLDPGVNRTYVADSSNASTGVVKLTFGDVGLTPGDQYWMHVDKETGRLKRWDFVLQHQPNNAPPSSFTWTGYESFSTPAGTLRVATRKEARGGNRALLTDAVGMPENVPEDMFTNPEPMLGE